MHSSWVTWLPVRNIFKFPCNVTILDLRSLAENTYLESNYDIFIVPFHNTDTPYIIFFKSDNVTDRNQECLHWDRNQNRDEL